MVLNLNTRLHGEDKKGYWEGSCLPVQDRPHGEDAVNSVDQQRSLWESEAPLIPQNCGKGTPQHLMANGGMSSLEGREPWTHIASQESQAWGTMRDALGNERAGVFLAAVRGT